MIGIIPTSSGRGTGWSRKTAGCSRSAMPASSVRSAAGRSRRRSSRSPRRGRTTAIGCSAATARCMCSATWRISAATNSSPGSPPTSRRSPTAPATRTLDETGAVWTHRSAGGPVAAPAGNPHAGRGRSGSRWSRTARDRGSRGRSRAVTRLGLRPGIVPPARRRALESVPRHRVEVRSAQRAAERARVLRGAVRLRLV